MARVNWEWKAGYGGLRGLSLGGPVAERGEGSSRSGEARAVMATSK